MSQKIDHFRMLIFGVSGSGKTHLLKTTILSHIKGVFDEIFIICPTYKNQDIYEKIKLKSKDNITDEVDNFGDILDKIKKNGKAEKNSLLIIDDAIGSDLMRINGPLAKEIIRIRHYKCSLIILSQKYHSIPPIIRINCNIFVLFYCTSKIERKKLEEDFGDVMYAKWMEFTGNQPYTYLYIDTRKNELDQQKYLNEVPKNFWIKN